MDDLMEKLQAMLADEESMNQIKQLAGMFGGAAEENQESNNTSDRNTNNNTSNNDFGFDMGTILQLQGLLKNVSSNDKNADLLVALKPHLREEKQAKVDKAIKLLKLFALWTVVKESGLLKSIDLF